MPLIGTFTRSPAKMPLLDLSKITAGLSKTWSGFLRDWDRSLRSGNYPETTRYNCLPSAVFSSWPAARPPAWLAAQVAGAYSRRHHSGKPAMEGVETKLRRGASVADVGCGFGHSTVIMAKAFPQSRFHGFDFHEPSIEAAQKLAEEEGLGDRVTFEVTAAQDLPGGDYDLITFFDCLHDLGDPGAALRGAEEVLADDGSCLVVEPNVSAEPGENIHPIGRSFASTSAVLCLPAAMAQDGPHALGNHPGQDALEAIAAEVGLHSWRPAVETLTNLIYDVRR
ncbi:class I SAM-dependent methyltransferase [Streptomyces sp. NPDC001530]|uniref:class I SAM-dependent methyltransferase n=1 Tax=Streptomyces sp. NPDC001530 TaxID=3364582 RepID=UPI0036D0826B